MLISTLHARLDGDGLLMMLCPCRCGHTLCLQLARTVDAAAGGYQHKGGLADLSILEMIKRPCWIGVIANGRAITARRMHSAPGF